MDFEQLQPKLPDGARRIHSFEELDQHLGNSPERVAEALGIVGKLRDNFIGNCFRNGFVLDAARSIPLVEFTGVPVDHPYALLNNTTRGYGDIRRSVEQLGQTRFQISPGAALGDGAFEATFRDLPGYFFDDLAIGSAKHVLVMDVPRADWEDVQQNLSVSPHNLTPHAFGVLGFDIDSSGNVKIQSIVSDSYGRLQDEGLRTKYAHWKEQLIDGFLYYLQVREHHRIDGRGTQWKLTDLQPTRIELADRSEEKEKIRNFLDAFSTLTGKRAPLPSNAFDVVDASAAELEGLPELLIERFGFRERVVWEAQKDASGAVGVVPKRSISYRLSPLPRETFLSSEMTRENRALSWSRFLAYKNVMPLLTPSSLPVSTEQ